MPEKLCKNLDMLMSEAHISADELSRRIGLPASSIKKIRNQENLNPTLSTLVPLAKYFSLSISQLIGDEPLPASRIKGLYQGSPETVSHIPLLSWKEAISWPSTINQPHNTIATEYEYGENAYALLVEEDDWENLTRGTALLVDPSLNVDHRDFTIAYKEGQSTPSLKQLLIDEGKKYLKPVVHGYNIVPLTHEYKLLGVVTEYKKHLKKNLLQEKNS